jgi:biopolymer transport protein ExbB
MISLKTCIKGLGAAALIGLSALASHAQQAPSLRDVLAAVERDSNQLTAENAQRLEAFKRDIAQQSAQVGTLRNEVAGIQNRARALSTEFNANEGRIRELDTQLKAEAGVFSELLGEFRTGADGTMTILSRSIASFEYPGRVESLAEVAQTRTLPTRAQLDRLPKAILREMLAQSEVKTFTANVANSGADGADAEQELLRIGVFSLATKDGKFVEVASRAGGEGFYLRVLGKQPSGAFRSAMTKLISAGEGEVVRAPVDPSKGDLFRIFGDLPTFNDRIKDGGEIGYIILALLAVGLTIGIYKLVTLSMMRGAMSATAKSKRAGKGDPLARVFETYELHKNADVETVELKLDETILKEMPRFERFNDIIKVLAGVAPLLGLLGTVVGMIITFTQITLYGAGDPQIMAGGISVALMTTVFGLVAAIPLLLIYALTSGAARGAQQILDEQAAGLVAERAEKLGKSGV